MILAEFQSLYPTGCLISELVQIYHGKYIVRVSVQIDGITRTTGMASAETIEKAEDQARDRALMILTATKVTQPTVAISPEPKVTTKVSPLQSEPIYSSTINLPPIEAIASTPAVEISTENNNQDINQTKSLTLTAKAEPYLEVPAENLDIKSSENFNNQLFPELGSSNVTPFPQRSPRSSSTPKQDAESPSTTTRKKKKSEPVDLSDVIAKTDVEIERLGWTKEQGREFLKSRYGKLGRTLLSEDELLDFLKYLESQPTPVDPLAGF